MQCPSNDNEHVQHCRKALNIVHGVTVHHVCNVQTCRFWQSSRRVFVCKTALHIHYCTPGGCPLALTTANGYDACPISGIESPHAPMVHSMATKVTGRGGGVRWVQTYAFKSNKGKHAKRSVLRNPPRPPPRWSGAQCQTLLASVCALNIPLPKLTVRIAKAAAKHCMYIALSDACIAAKVYGPASQCPPVVIKAICTYVQRVHNCLDPKPTLHVLTCTIFSLLAVGYTVRKTVVFPTVAWMTHNTPELTLYSNVAHVQCRAMSTCTRAIKRAVLAQTGLVPLFLFPELPGQTTTVS